MNDALIYGIAIGASVTGFIFIALSRNGHTESQKRALAIASGAIGFSVSWWCYRHPYEIENLMETVAGKAIAIVLSALGVALVYWKIKSFFSS